MDHLYTYYAAHGRSDVLDEIGSVPTPAASPEACITERWGNMAHPERFVVIDHTDDTAHVFKVKPDGTLRRVVSVSEKA